MITQFSVSLVYVLLILILVQDDNAKKIEKRKKEIVTIAHRGASGLAPENTIASFDKAIDLNADFLELDIQMTRDGVLVVFHDALLNRTSNGNGYLKDYRIDELKKLDAGSWFHRDFRNEKIPTLEEVIFRYKKRTKLLIELKDPHLYPSIEQRLAKQLKKAKLGYENVIVQSFSAKSILKFKKLERKIPIGILSRTPLSTNRLEILSRYADYYNPPAFLLDIDSLIAAHDLNYKVFTWTVNQRERFNFLNEIGVDGIITDFPNIKEQPVFYPMTEKGIDVMELFTKMIHIAYALYERIKDVNNN